MIAVSASVEIGRPAEDVFAFLSDFSNNPRWQRGMRSAIWTSDGPIGAGSTYDQIASFLGRKVITSFEVVDYEPGRSVSIRSTSGTFPIQVTRTVEPLGPGRCAVSADVRGEPGRIFGMARPLLRRLVERSVRGDYARLKALLESGAVSGP